VRRNRAFLLSVESLDERQLPSSGMAGTWPIASAAHLGSRLSFSEAITSATDLVGRVMTPEARQAVERRLARTFRLVKPGLNSSGPRALIVTRSPGPMTPQTLAFIALAIPANAPLVTQAIIDLTNHVRAEHGIALLSQNPALTEGAQLHSQDMAETDQMLHEISGVPLGSLVDRAQYVHYSYQLLGENIAYNQADAASVVAAWMNSPPHRQNLLNPLFTDIGVGLAWNQRGEPYYTVMLARPA
jgi:uncharacterized protein YkwD